VWGGRRPGQTPAGLLALAMSASTGEQFGSLTVRPGSTTPYSDATGGHRPRTCHVAAAAAGAAAARRTAATRTPSSPGIWRTCYL